MAADNGFDFTATQRRLYEALKDGQPHHPDDLRKLLNDDMAGRSTLSVHISNMREKLELKGLDIWCVWHRRDRFYRMTRRMHDPSSD